MCIDYWEVGGELFRKEKKHFPHTAFKAWSVLTVETECKKTTFVSTFQSGMLTLTFYAYKIANRNFQQCFQSKYIEVVRSFNRTLVRVSLVPVTC